MKQYNVSNNQQPKQLIKQNRKRRITYLEEDEATKNKDGSNEEDEPRRRRVNQKEEHKPGRRRRTIKKKHERMEEEEAWKNVEQEAWTSDSYGRVAIFFYSEQVQGILALSPWLLGAPYKYMFVWANPNGLIWPKLAQHHDLQPKPKTSSFLLLCKLYQWIESNEHRSSRIELNWVSLSPVSAQDFFFKLIWKLSFFGIIVILREMGGILFYFILTGCQEIC